MRARTLPTTTHTNTHTHTHTHTPSLTHRFTLEYPHKHANSLSYAFMYTYTQRHTQTHSYTTSLLAYSLTQYIILVLVVFAAELVGGILSFVYRDQVQALVTDGIATTFTRYNGTNTADVAVTFAWDAVQSNVSYLTTV